MKENQMHPSPLGSTSKTASTTVVRQSANEGVKKLTSEQIRRLRETQREIRKEGTQRQALSA